jgi:uncharacterized protein YjdB
MAPASPSIPEGLKSIGINAFTDCRSLTSVKLPSTLTLKKGKSKTLKYTLPSGTYTSKVTWTSSNKKIATVNSSGKVTAKKKGSCTITATTHNGKTATCTVTVK